MNAKNLSTIVCIAIANLFSLINCRAAVSTTDAEGRLVQLLEQYQLPRTLHCKVTTKTQYKITPPGVFDVEGSQEYWVDGPKYRIVQLMNSSLLEGMSHDVRWDGQQFQWLNLADSTLIISNKPRQKTPYIGEPIPLLPLGFLNPGGRDLGVRLSLDELRDEEIRNRLADAHWIGADRRVAEFPGGAIGGMNTTYHIEFGGSPNYLPTTIRRMSPDGVALDTDEIEYEPVECTNGVLYLPNWARVTIRTTDNQIYMVATSKVTLIEPDNYIPPETFTVDFQTAKNVINIDRISRRVASIDKRDVVHAVIQPKPTGADVTRSFSSAESTVNAEDQWPASTIGLLAISLAAVVTGSVMVLRMKPASGARQ
jgi:hypothetical protein